MTEQNVWIPEFFPNDFSYQKKQNEFQYSQEYLSSLEWNQAKFYVKRISL